MPENEREISAILFFAPVIVNKVGRFGTISVKDRPMGPHSQGNALRLHRLLSLFRKPTRLHAAVDRVNARRIRFSAEYYGKTVTDSKPNASRAPGIDALDCKSLDNGIFSGINTRRIHARRHVRRLVATKSLHVVHKRPVTQVMKLYNFKTHLTARIPLAIYERKRAAASCDDERRFRRHRYFADAASTRESRDVRMLIEFH